MENIDMRKNWAKYGGKEMNWWTSLKSVIVVVENRNIYEIWIYVQLIITSIPAYVFLFEAQKDEHSSIVLIEGKSLRNDASALSTLSA